MCIEKTAYKSIFNGKSPLVRKRTTCIQFKMLVMVYRAIHGLAPEYVSDMLQFRSSSGILRSADTQILTVPRTRLRGYGDHAVSHAAPKLWNDLLKISTSLNIFRSRLKTFLFKSFIFVKWKKTHSDVLKKNYESFFEEKKSVRMQDY